MSNGDILLFFGGDMAQISEIDWPSNGYVRVQFLEEKEERSIPKSQALKAKNLGQESTTAIIFNMARSIHVRLNRLGNV